MNAGNLDRIVRLNYLIGGVLVIAAAVTQPRDIALGVAVGVAITCVNFFLLGRLVGKWTRDAAEGNSTTAGSLLVLPKMVGLMAVVVLCLWLLPINAAAFAVGFGIFFVSIMVELLLAALLPEKSNG